MARISIITPWLDHLELIPAYEEAVRGAEVIIVDNGSAASGALECMVNRLEGLYIRNKTNQWFTTANNQGLAVATGDIVVFLNNDVRSTGPWLPDVVRDTERDVLVGPGLEMKLITGQPIIYVEGWCIAAQRDVWDKLDGWDAVSYPRPYWEDVDLSWRAARMGIRLRKAFWSIEHLGNTTSREVQGAYDASATNQRTFEQKVREARGHA